MQQPIVPELTGIPETMLWTLHNRAQEAMRPDGILKDIDAIRIYDAIDFNYVAHFGKANGGHALRSKVFDDALVPWLREHPGGTIVNLGEGLETQVLRLQRAPANWVSVDVPSAMKVRELFISESDNRRHVRKSALDFSWMSCVDDSKGLFITAQGLFMYFEEEQVRALIYQVFKRFPHACLMFDAIPPWFSQKSLRGEIKTSIYRAPPMPWGIKFSQVESVIRTWIPDAGNIEVCSLSMIRGVPVRLFAPLLKVPYFRDWAPCIVKINGTSACR